MQVDEIICPARETAVWLSVVSRDRRGIAGVRAEYLKTYLVGEREFKKTVNATDSIEVFSPLTVGDQRANV